MTSSPNIDWVLDHEIRLSSRYRRFLSVVVVSADRDAKALDQVLSETIRSSDACFAEQDAISVVMGETDSEDALHAIARYKRAINSSMKVQYAVATFPADGRTPKDLRLAALSRLEKARKIGPGSVVYEG